MNDEFRKMLRSPQKRAFHDAVDSLRRIPSQQAIQLLDELRIEGDSELRCRCLIGLLEISPHLAEVVGLQMLGDINPTVRWRAVYCVTIVAARNGIRTAVPAFINVLKTDSGELVRSLAAFALGDIGDSSALPALEAAAANDQGTDHEGVRISDTARAAIQKIKMRAGA